MKSLTLTLLFSLVFSGVAISCSCAGEAYFCQELQDTTDIYIHPKYVIRATKLEDITHGMIVKIENQYIGVIEEDTITVWGDPGHLCRVYTSNFAIGDELILGINKFEEAGPMAGESIGDYWFPACGVTYLDIEDEMVTGPISMNVNSMPLSEFETYMFKEGYLSACFSTNTFGLPDKILEFNIYPNPSSDLVMIDLKNNESIPNLQVYNSIGQQQTVNYNPDLSRISMDLSNLSEGIYFIKMSFPDQDFIRKIIVNRY